MDKEGLIKKFGLTGVTAQSTDKEIEDAIQVKLDAEKNRADNAEAAMQAANKKRITDTVNAAAKAGKIQAGQTATFMAIGEKSGVEALETVLGGMKPAPSLVEVTRGGAANMAGAANGARADWGWEQWQKEDPRGLEALAKSEPEKFEALYKATFKGK